MPELSFPIKIAYINQNNLLGGNKQLKLRYIFC